MVEDPNLKGTSGVGYCLAEVTGCSGVDTVIDVVVEAAAACVVVVAAVAEPAGIAGTGEAGVEDRRRKVRYT